MKKTKTYLFLFVITICIIGLTFDVIIPSSYALVSLSHVGANYNDQVLWQQDHLWHLGKNLSVGDSYTYKICDPKTIQTSAANYHYFTQGNENHNSSVCYIIKMDFVNLLNSDENQINGDVWVVQAAISNYLPNRDDVRYSVFHLDAKTFEVSSANTIHPDTIKYADSLQDTLFSLFKYTAPEPQLLQIGTQWGEVTEVLHEQGYNPQMAVLDNNQEYSVIQNHANQLNHQNVPVERNIVDAFQVGYEIDIVDPLMISDDKKNKTEEKEEDDNNNVVNVFLISSDLPFPLSAVSYSPVHVIQPQKQFEFELVSFLTNNKNVDFEIKKPVFEEPKDNVSELLTERGIIELTFPDDVIPDDDMEIISHDEIDNDVISKDEDMEVISENDDAVEIIPDDSIKINYDSIDYSKISGLVILLVVMIAGFVVFKKLREGKLRMNSMKKTLKKTKIVKKTVILFEEKLHIDIKTLTDDDI